MARKLLYKNTKTNEITPHHKKAVLWFRDRIDIELYDLVTGEYIMNWTW